MNRPDYSGLLYARSSAISGFARALDMWAVFDDYNDTESSEEADRIATASDWYAVGSDLLGSLRGFAARHGIKLTHARPE